MFDTAHSIRESLKRAVRLRQLNAPRLVVRNEQIFLWALRRLKEYPELIHAGPTNIPGWKENYLKFVAIHEIVIDRPH